MDNVGQENTASTSQNQTDLTISIAASASSMINASDKIPPDTYQANLKRIQDMKEIVRTLEMNNETGHKNFLIDELEKRAKEGREAEEMLTRLKNTQGLPDTIQFTNHAPNDRAELPSTATLVEVPEARTTSPSYSPPTASAAPRPSQPAQLPQSQWPVQPPSSYNRAYSNSNRPFIHYVPNPVTHRPTAYSTAPLHPRAPIGTQGWGNARLSGYATQNVAGIPPQHAFNAAALPTSYQTTQPRQPPQPWNVWPPQAAGLQTTSVTQAPGYSIPSAIGQDVMSRIQPGPGASSAGPSIPGPYTQPAPSHFPVYQVPLSTVQNQPLNLPSRAESSQILQASAGTQVRQSSGQPTPVQSRTKPTESSSRPPFPGAASQQAPISFPEAPRHPPQHLQQRLPQQVRQSSSQQPLLSTQQPPQTRSQQPDPPPHSQSEQSPPQAPPPQHFPQTQPQQPPQPSLPPQQQHALRFPSQQLASSAPSVSSPAVPQVPSGRPAQARDAQSLDATSRIQPTKPSQPASVSEQNPQQSPKPPMDQSTFIRRFQAALQHGPQIMKAFWLHSLNSGVDKEWFQVAINTIPRPTWDAFVAQAKQPSSESVAPRPSEPQQKVASVPGPSMPVVNAQPPSTSQPVETTPATQLAKAPFSIPNGITHSAPGQPVIPYAMAAQMKYYSDEATRATLAAQGVNIPAAGPQSSPMPQTPERSVPQTESSPRTPRDANKSTLARDILRSLGKPSPKPKERRIEPSNELSSPECERHLPEPTSSTMDPSGASPKPTITAASVHVRSPSPPPEQSVVIPDVPQVVVVSSRQTQESKEDCRPFLQGVASPRPSAVSEAERVPQEQPKQDAVIEGPIMIDLTLEDSDESVDGSGQKPTFPIQTAAGVPTSHPVPRTNTTIHTPLLENLSLEEAPIEVAIEGEHADLRMQSPPLPLTVAEEDVESELLYPNEMGSTSSSSNVPPRAATERPASSQLPLFLPSPPVSPTPSRNTVPLELDDEMNVAKDENRPFLKRRSVEADGMEVDTDSVSPVHVRKRRKQRAYVLIPPPAPPIKKLIRKMKERVVDGEIVSGSESGEEDEELRYNPLERLLIEESKSRLLERRCRWSNCDAILNSGTSLLAHLIQHEENSQTPFVCHWAACRRQLNTREERDIHLERHAIRPLPCPFAGCDEQFDKPIQAMQHEVQHQSDHQQPLMGKPTYKPIVPAIPVRLGPPPHRLPSHRVIPRRVVKSTISADRHAVMGPWVLWNIFSPVELSLRKQNAPMRGRPSRQGVVLSVNDLNARHDYDFLLPISSYSAKIPQLDDLDSPLITLDAARGLTVWGSGADLNSSPRLATPGQPANGGSVALEAMAGATSSNAEKTTGGGNPDDHVAALASLREEDVATSQEELGGQPIAIAEEEDVERMLVL